MSERITRRKLLQWVGGAAAFSALSVACAGAPEPTAAPAPTKAPAAAEATKPAAAAPTATVAQKAAASGPVNVRWAMYTYEPWLNLLKEIFKEYQAAKPGTTVELVSAPWNDFWPKIEAMAASGDPVNVSIAEPQYSLPWAKRELLVDLTPELKSVAAGTFFTTVTCANVANTSTWFMGCKSGGNRMFTFPGNGTAWLAYLNLDLVKAAGLTPPGEDWTWDDFKKFCITLTKDKAGKHPGESGFDKSNIVQYGVGNLFADQKNLKTFIWHAGGQQWDDEQTKSMFSDPKSLQAIEFLYDLTVTNPTSPSAGDFQGIAQPFLTNKIGMWLTGSWNVDPWVKDVKDFAWDIQRIPVGPAGKERRYGHTGFGNSLALFKTTKGQDAALDVFKYALWTKEGSAWFGTAGVPCVQAAAQDKKWLDAPEGKHLPAHRELQLKMMAEEAGYDAIEPHSLWENDMFTLLGNELPNLALGRAKPADWAQGIDKQINDIFKKARSQ